MKRCLEYWAQQTQWWCSRSFEWWAAHFTALYVGGAILIMGARFDELIKLELNAIGDLSAGVFGPVAFLWLVLGYIQQGRELKISSDALANQTEELRHSVEQQKTMAAINESQLRLNEQNARLQNAQLLASIEPRFVLKFDELANPHGPATHLLRLLNAGHGITCVNCNFNNKRTWSFDQIESKETKVFEIDNQVIGEDKDMVFRITYLNGIQEEVTMKFNIKIDYRNMVKEWIRYVSPPNGKRED